MCDVIVDCGHVCKDLDYNIGSSCWGMNAFSQVESHTHRIKIHLNSLDISSL